jgi:hypothetical protein
VLVLRILLKLGSCAVLQYLKGLILTISADSRLCLPHRSRVFYCLKTCKWQYRKENIGKTHIGGGAYWAGGRGPGTFWPQWAACISGPSTFGLSLVLRLQVTHDLSVTNCLLMRSRDARCYHNRELSSGVIILRV